MHRSPIRNITTNNLGEGLSLLLLLLHATRGYTSSYMWKLRTLP